MKLITQTISRLDTFQQHHPILAFPLAVSKKYNDDQAGNMAALITYYAFLSLFPLLLVLVSIAEIISKTNASLAHHITDAAFNFFPVIGTQLQDNLQSGHRSGVGLFFGIIISLLGARGVADTIQLVVNNLWEVDKAKRSAFPRNLLRSLAIILLGGGGLIITSLLIGSFSHWTSILAKILIIPLTLGLNFCVFWGVYRLSVARVVKTKHLIVGALITAVAWQILQSVGSYLLLSKLKGLSTVYGLFAVVLGLLFWIFLEAKIMLYAVEIDTVRTKKLWPRSLL